MLIEIKQRGQITIPLKLRELLGLHEGTSLFIEVEDEKITLKPVKYKLKTIDELYGSIKLPKNKRHLDIDEAIELAKVKKAREFVEYHNFPHAK